MSLFNNYLLIWIVIFGFQISPIQLLNALLHICICTILFYSAFIQMRCKKLKVFPLRNYLNVITKFAYFKNCKKKIFCIIVVRLLDFYGCQDLLFFFFFLMVLSICSFLCLSNMFILLIVEIVPFYVAESVQN